MTRSTPARRSGLGAAPSKASAILRIGIIGTTGFVAFTALAGGAMLMLGPSESVMVPPRRLLEAVGLHDWLIPGMLLAVVVGGSHALAFDAALRRRTSAALATAFAAFALLVWIFVETVLIPWSALQAAYFAIGLAEMAMVLIGLGVLAERTDRLQRPPNTPTQPHREPHPVRRQS